MRMGRLTWYEHLERKGDADWVKSCSNLVAEGTAHFDRPKKTWQEHAVCQCGSAGN